MSKKIKCIVCHQEFDIRDVFFLMKVPYCAYDVVYPIVHRLNDDQKNDFRHLLLN